jgi:hypothetical protein
MHEDYAESFMAWALTGSMTDYLDAIERFTAAELLETYAMRRTQVYLSEE